MLIPHRSMVQSPIWAQTFFFSLFSSTFFMQEVHGSIPSLGYIYFFCNLSLSFTFFFHARCDIVGLIICQIFYRKKIFEAIKKLAKNQKIAREASYKSATFFTKKKKWGYKKFTKINFKIISKNCEWSKLWICQFFFRKKIFEAIRKLAKNLKIAREANYESAAFFIEKKMRL